MATKVFSNATDIYDVDIANQTESSINQTRITLPPPPVLTEDAMIRVWVLSILAVVSLIGNTVTIWSIVKTRLSRRIYRQHCSAVYRLVLHLSISDILVTAFCMVGDAVWSYTVEWLAGDFLCKTFKFFQMFSLYLSTYVLVLIGIDRWVAVKYPMKSLNKSERFNRLLIGAYVGSLLLSIPQSVIFNVVQGPFNGKFLQCHTEGSYDVKWQEQLYTTFTLLCMFIIPLGIIIATYLSTFRTIAGSAQVFNRNQEAKSLENGNDSIRRKLIEKAKKKSAKISLIIVSAFVICWTPYYVMMIIFMFWKIDRELAENLQSKIFFFGMTNSLVNPIIYGAFHFWPNKRARRRDENYRRETSIQTTTSHVPSIQHQNSSTSYMSLKCTPKNSIKSGKFQLIKKKSIP